ncbi:DUF4468 domain-containing protein [Labilibaculum euxinus]
MSYKVLFTLMVFIIGSSAIAQLPRNEKNGQIEYSEVVQLEGMTKDEIYKKTKLWMISTLKSGDNMVELDGTTSDQIVGTGNLMLSLNKEADKTKWRLKLENGYLNFKFIVFCKDGRLKYQVNNFNLHFERNFPQYRDINTDLESFNISDLSNKEVLMFKDYALEAVDRNIKTLILNFKSNFQTSPVEDW